MKNTPSAPFETELGGTEPDAQISAQLGDQRRRLGAFGRRPAVAASCTADPCKHWPYYYSPARRQAVRDSETTGRRRKGKPVTTETVRGGGVGSCGHYADLATFLASSWYVYVVVGGEGLADAREGGKADAGDGEGSSLPSGGLAHCLARGGAKVFWDRRWAWLACLLHRGRGLHSAWEREQKRYRGRKKSQRRQQTKSTELAEPRAGFNAAPLPAHCTVKARTVH